MKKYDGYLFGTRVKVKTGFYAGQIGTVTEWHSVGETIRYDLKLDHPDAVGVREKHENLELLEDPRQLRLPNLARCPACHGTSVETERRPNGYSSCPDCGRRALTKDFFSA